MTVRRGYVQTSDGNVHYRYAGESGQHVLLLHQTPLGSDTYTEVVERLGRDHRAVALDTLGFGDSDAPKGKYSIPEYAGAVVRVLDALGWESTHIVGRLTGSVFAAEVAATVPGRIESVVLSCLPDYDDSIRPQKLAAINPMQYRPDGSQARQVWDRSFTMNPNADPAIVHRTMVMSLKSGERAEEAHEAVFKYDVKPRLPAIEAPVLLLYTKSDGFQDRLEFLTPLIRRHKLKYISGGSNVLMEDPDAFANAVAAFITSPGI